MDVFEVQHSKRRGYKFGNKQDQSFCWCYHYQFVMSAKAGLNSSARHYCPQVIACFSVLSHWLFFFFFEKALPVQCGSQQICSRWSCGFEMHGFGWFCGYEFSKLSKAKEKQCSYSASPPTTRHICLHMQILRSSYACYLKFHTEIKRLSFLLHSRRRAARAPSIR